MRNIQERLLFVVLASLCTVLVYLTQTDPIEAFENLKKWLEFVFNQLRQNASTIGLWSTLILVIGVIIKIWQHFHQKKTLNQLIDLPKSNHAVGTNAVVPPNVTGTSPLARLFDSDFPCFCVFKMHDVVTDNHPTPAKIRSHLYYDSTSGTKFLGFFVYAYPSTYDLCLSIPRMIEQLKLKDGIPGVSMNSNKVGDFEPVRSKNMVFSTLIYVYHENDLDIKQMGKITEGFELAGYNVILRGPRYVAARLEKDGVLKRSQLEEKNKQLGKKLSK
jgi:hypothetical protein